MEQYDRPPQLPLCLALVLADYIHRDRGTNKRTIIGTFSEVYVRGVPSVVPLIAVYGAMTDGMGLTPIEVRIVHIEDEDEPVTRAEGNVNFPDPRAVVEMDLYLPNVQFNAVGEHRVQLVAAGEILIERRLSVVDVTPPQAEDADHA